MNRLMTRRNFEAWLRGRKSKEVVGLRKMPGECPLACYLRDQGVAMPYVSSEYYIAEPFVEGCADLPSWAKRFVRDIDYGRFTTWGGSYADDIPAREVRRILRSKHT